MLTKEERKDIRRHIALSGDPAECCELYDLIKADNKERQAERYQAGKKETRKQAQTLQIYEDAITWGELAESLHQLEQRAKKYGLIKELKREGIL